jgi:hypothetical protein
MQAALKKLGVNCLWHFTDEKNYQSIADNGLLSWKQIKLREIKASAPGGNDWSHDADAMAGVDDYVHLAFSRQHPMLYVAQQEGRISKPIWLKIDLAVLEDVNVKFTNAVSNKSGVLLLDNEQAKAQVDLTALFTFLDFKENGNRERKQSAEKSEILVPKMILPKNILGLVDG